MDFELEPRTPAGERFLSLVTGHIPDFAGRADQHDRAGDFPFENIKALQQSGVMAALVPEEFGGLGVDSIHDYMVGINRLGRGDGATAIAANMHIYRAWRITRGWKAARAAGNIQETGRAAHLLRRIGAGEIVIGALLSEPGTDLIHPLTEATSVEGGYRLNGHKIFGTISPAADILEVTCRAVDRQERPRRVLMTVPRGSVGMEIKNNWDALGMRASGSHDVVFTDCFVPDDAAMDTGPWGEWSDGFLANNTVITMGLVGAFLGIAEAARRLILEMMRTRRNRPTGRPAAERYAIQHTIAEIEIDLAASRAMLGRTAIAADELFATYARGRVPMDEMHHLAKEFQCTKWFVTRKAIEIVDRALTLSGGAGYLSRSPLSRLYRDVRAGPFMQPFSPNEAFEYIGKVTLGLDPTLDV